MLFNAPLISSKRLTIRPARAPGSVWRTMTSRFADSLVTDAVVSVTAEVIPAMADWKAAAAVVLSLAVEWDERDAAVASTQQYVSRKT